MSKAVAAALFVGLSSQVALAEAVDPVRAPVEELQGGLLSIMRAGASAGQSGRERMIGPVIDDAFDIPLMTRLAVGPAWTGIAARDQASLVSAFRGLTIAQYAKNFYGYSGEKFAVSPTIQTRGSDKLVRTTLALPGGKTESLGYRLRSTGGKWKIIDIYYRNSISQLATRRADFAKVLSKGGAKALIAHLNRLAEDPR